MHQSVLTCQLRDLPLSDAPWAAVSSRSAYVDIPSDVVRGELPEHDVVNRHKHCSFM